MTHTAPAASMATIVAVQPPHFARPRGYLNGALTTGRTLFVAGQVGWEHDGRFVARDLPAQFARALDHVLDVVREAGGGPEHLARMTIYVTDLDAYRNATREIGAAWRERMGRHYPAMALVGVAGLVEREALVEIEATAVLPFDDTSPHHAPRPAASSTSETR